jgi:hypothetical protein
MAGSSLAGIITASASVFTALALLVTAIGVLIPNLRATRRAVAQVDQVHTIVNQQRTDMQRFIRAQSALLRKHGIEPPIDQSIDPDDRP